MLFSSKVYLLIRKNINCKISIHKIIHMDSNCTGKVFIVHYYVWYHIQYDPTHDDHDDHDYDHPGADRAADRRVAGGHGVVRRLAVVAGVQYGLHVGRPGGRGRRDV